MLGERPGYAQPDVVDPTGYSLHDLGRAADGEMSDAAGPPLGQRDGRLSLATYGDDTVHPVPGGVLGEAGACGTPEGLGIAMLPEALTEQHAIRAGLAGIRSEDSAWSHEQPQPDPPEYTGREPRGAEKSDTEVYRDLYSDGND